MITQLICLLLCLLLCAWFFHQTWFLSKEYKLTDLSNPLENDNNVSLQRAVGFTISMFSPSELKSLWPKCIVTFRGYAIFSYRAILLYLRLCILFFCHKKGWSIGGDTWLELSNISRLSALCCKVCTRVTLRIWVKCEEVKFDNTFMLKEHSFFDDFGDLLLDSFYVLNVYSHTFARFLCYLNSPLSRCSCDTAHKWHPFSIYLTPNTRMNKMERENLSFRIHQ